MTPKVIKVNLIPNYKLELLFSTGELKFFNVKPYFKFNVYKQLKDNWPNLKPCVCNGTVCLDEKGFIDFDPDILYLESVIQAEKQI